MSSVTIPGYSDTTPSEDRDAWLFDYIVAFLKSPPWTVPLNTFIDENSVIFDNEEENKFVHTDCHERFKRLIEDLLSRNLMEIGITEEEFVSACSRGQSSSHELNKLIFGQILAVDDFLTFKKMMYKRNMELEVEALKAISDFQPGNEDEAQLQLELALALSQSGDKATRVKMPESDEAIQAALKASILEQERIKAEYEREQAELEHAIALSLALEAERLRQAEEVLERQQEEEKAAIEASRVDAKAAKESKKSEPTKQEAAPEKKITQAAAPASSGPSSSASDEMPPAAAAPLLFRQLTSQSANMAKIAEEDAKEKENQKAAETAKTNAAPAATPAPVSASKPAAAPAPAPASSSQFPPIASSKGSSAPVTSLPPLIHRAPAAMALSDYENMKAEHDRLLAKADSVFRQNEASKKQRAEAEIQTLKKVQLTEEELKRRAEFMRAQRELLLKKKNAEREAELRAFEDEKSECLENQGKSKASEEEARRKAMREALANRLKSDMDQIEAKRAKESGAITKYSSIHEQLAAADRLREEKMSRQPADQAALAAQEKERQAKLQKVFQTGK